jgi:hypothetical protein
LLASHTLLSSDQFIQAKLRAAFGDTCMVSVTLLANLLSFTRLPLAIPLRRYSEVGAAKPGNRSSAMRAKFQVRLPRKIIIGFANRICWKNKTT